MLYTVVIPQSKTKRLNTELRLVKIILSESDGGRIIEHWISPNELEFKFDVPDQYEYIYKSNCIDGETFRVTVTYYNQTKSREETIELVPS